MGPIGSLFGIGDASAPDVGAASGSAADLMRALIAMQPAAFSTQATYAPQYTALSEQDIGSATGSLASLIEKYIPGINAAINGANAQTSAAGVNDAAVLGPAAAAAIRAINPGAAGEMGDLTDITESALRAGTTLAPSDYSNITKSVRDNWASRGLGDSGPAQLDEALQLEAGGQNVLAQRESAAGAAAQLGSNLFTLPALSLTQKTSSAPGATGGVLGMGESVAGPTGNTLTDPSSILNAAYNAQAAAQITSANNAAGLNSY